MAQRKVERVADIPVPLRSPELLFRLRGTEAAAVAGGYHGYSVPPRVSLIEEEGLRTHRTLERPLVVQLHAYDEQSPESVAARDIDLGFWFDEDEWYEDDDPDEMDFVIVATLSLFFERRLPAIVHELGTSPDAVVVGVCNSGRVPWVPPEGWEGPPIWFPMGDASLDAVDHGDWAEFRLRAPLWRRVAPDSPKLQD